MAYIRHVVAKSIVHYKLQNGHKLNNKLEKAMNLKISMKCHHLHQQVIDPPKIWGCTRKPIIIIGNFALIAEDFPA